MKQIKLGFLTVHGDTENHSQMMSGVFETAKNNNANVIRFAAKVFDDDLSKFNLELNNLYKIIEAQKLDGLMFLGWMPGLVGKYFNDFLKRFNSIPLVSLGTKYENVPNVYGDPEKCIRELMEHMINVHGYKRIVFIQSPNLDLRNIVYEDVMKKYGLYQDELIISYTDLIGIPLEDRMKRVLSILIDERKVKFDAILVMLDEDAQKLLKELMLRGINVPADVAMASYDDTEFANYSIPALTTITYPWREVGSRGCEKIIKLINREYIEYSTGIASKLIIRNSCGCTTNITKLFQIENRFKTINPVRKFDNNHILEISDEIRKAFPYTQINVEKLMYLLFKDFEEGTTSAFLSEFEYEFQEILHRDHYINRIDEIEELIHYLQSLVASYISNENEKLMLFENIIYKALVIIKEKEIEIIGFNHVQIKKIDQELHYASQNLIDTFSIKELLSELEKSLPKLEIPSCYVFLFNENSFEKCTLIFKFENYKRVIIDDTYVTSQYISDEIIEKHKKVLCQLLYVNDDYLGFIVFEPWLIDERIYHTLSLHISSALKGAILLENLTEEIALRKEKEKQLIYIASYDSLTGLFNRRHFYETINYVISKSAEYSKEKLSFFLLFIDIDGFKQVNDNLGHGIGDVLLKEIAKRLKASLKDNSYQIPSLSHNHDGNNMEEAIFRLGGDEFTAMVSGISIEEMGSLAEKLIAAIKVPYFIHEQEIYISCSVGISIYPDHAANSELIIKYADWAMYRAKEQKSMHYFFDKVKFDKSLYKQTIEKELKTALLNNQINVYYQGLFNADNKIIGIEALVRWIHPKHGILKPEEFISIAIKTNLMAQIDEYVLKIACNNLKELHNLGYKDIFVLVNCTEKQFYDPNCIAKIKADLEKADLEPKFLRLGLQGETLLKDMDKSLLIINGLSEVGVKVTIDGVGKGDSVIDFIKSIPEKAILKIDRVYLQNITLNKNNYDNLLFLIDLINNEKLKTIVSGIETLDQRELLIDRNCILQGYYFNKPEPFDVLKEDICMRI